MLPNRRDTGGPRKPENPLFSDPQLKDTHPTLYAFLMDDKYSDGTPRQTGSFSVFNKYGSLIMAVNDNDRGLTAFVSMPTWDELLFIVEVGLAKDDLDWRKKSAFGNTQKPPF